MVIGSETPNREGARSACCGAWIYDFTVSVLGLSGIKDTQCGFKDEEA